MAIPLYQQYFVEKDRNYKFEFLVMMVTMLLPLLHGIMFLWIPWFLRSRRDLASLKYKPYFTFVKYFDSFTRVFRMRILGKTFFFQPSLLVVWAIHIGLCAWFCVAETKDINYQPRSYVISKRIGRISIGCLPMILLFVAKNNVVASLSGLTLDKSVFFHKWLGRFMFITATVHMALSLQYWLGLKFNVMVEIPPQIFGFIAYSCLGMLNVASFKFIRNFAFDLFLAQHRVFNFVMLLLVYFHNGGNHAAVILGVHLLVIDRVTSRVLGIIHKRKGPTKGISDFEILDETTIRISIPISIKDFDNHKWWWCFVPMYGNWRAGQHIALNVSKVSFFQYHPFTIASLPDSGKMVLVIKVHKGFTRKLKKKLLKIKLKQDEEASNCNEMSPTASSPRSFSDSRRSSREIRLEEITTKTLNSCTELMKGKENNGIKVSAASIKDFKELIDSFTTAEIFKLRAGINGPYGGDFQPLTRFDSVVLFSAGSGASFTLPVALDLLKTIKEREEAEDYLYRPRRTAINIVLAMKKLENLKWYDHLWAEFLPFLSSGKAQLSVHITQEVPDAAKIEGEEEDDVPVQEQHHENEQNDPEKVMLYLTGSSSTNRCQSFATTVSSTLSVENSGFSITYSRPNFESIIGEMVRLVSSKEYRKSFACLGCGPHTFNGEIKRFCQKNRWVEGAPDVYCYTESFG